MKQDPLQPRPLLKPAEALTEANRCQGCVEPACQKGCPLSVDVGAFIRRIQTGNWAGALRIMYERNPLPETCALICPVETLCEGKCNSGEFSFPIRISDLQQAAAHYGSETFRQRGPSSTQPAGSIAIIGGGPAGLACAARLRLDGFDVHLFEKADVLGGALTRWIPAYRLPRNVLNTEIQRILDLGVTVHTGQALGRDLSLADLRHKFDAVFLALGLGGNRQTQLANRDGGGVFDALQMLELANAGQLTNLPGPVVVIGGGNTAIDAAATARYLGADEVYLVYRRGFVQMPAWPDERRRAIDLGIHVLILLRPIEYVRNPQGDLVGLRCLRTRLHPDSVPGRRDMPIDVPDSEFVLPAGSVIEAMGQRPDDLATASLASLQWADGVLSTDPDTRQTSLPGVFAGGDLINGGRTAVDAIADAIRAAQSIANYVQRHKSR